MRARGDRNANTTDSVSIPCDSEGIRNNGVKGEVMRGRKKSSG